MAENQTETIINTLTDQVESLRINLENNRFILQIQKAAELLASSSNRIIVTGMGKSGLIARKTAATLTSTGTPAVFLHPADALHGDMGNILPKEVVLAFSNSGETREIIELLPNIKVLGAKLVAVTQVENSALAKEAEAPVIFKITKEGCPLNLAPMASTTVSLCIGDAIASALIKIKKFEVKDFGRFHPSGSLGKKILTKVSDVMPSAKNFAVSKKETFKNVLSEMVSSNLGALLVTGSKGHLRGIITDGDLKRLLDKYELSLERLMSKSAEEIMSPEPAFVYPEILVEEALAIMHEKKTYILPVVDKSKKPTGVIRMHDIIAYSK
ncbi:MAG: KpsF/GutQ family sugar-phosphate isomerase [Spirochaetia bacterium]|nr:KpsF/GutQ family sugar-phosphate isomerase [Spirochaetia bacterium]